MSIEGPIRTVQNGLIFHLDAANNKSYPGTGTDWRDLTQINGTGSLINGPTYSSANVGSIVFDGTNDYVECGNFADNLGEMTVSAWINMTNASGNGYTNLVTKIADLSTGAGWGFVFYQQKISFSTQNAGGAQYRFFNSTTSFSTYFGKWTNVVATLSGGVNGTILLYINAISQTLQNQSAGTVTNITTTTPVRIAWKDAGAQVWFPGNIANVSIYNRALSPNEILQNYNAAKSRFGL